MPSAQLNSREFFNNSLFMKYYNELNFNYDKLKNLYFVEIIINLFVLFCFFRFCFGFVETREIIEGLSRHFN